MGIFDMFFSSGNSGASTAEAAGRTVQQAAQQGQGMLQGGLERAMGLEMPWQQSGSSANSLLGALFNLPGYGTIDMTKTLEATPGYKFLQGQGVSALNRAGAAGGLTGSGALGAGLTSFGQNLADVNAWQPFVNQLNIMSEQGRGTAGLMGGQNIQVEGAKANLGMQGAEASAQAQMNALALDQQKTAMQSSNLGGLLGMGIGAYGSGMLGGGGPFGKTQSIFSNIGGLFDMGGAFGGAMAEGGPVKKGGLYLVGERGPELFRAKEDGYIIPNHLTEYSQAVGF